MRKQEDRADITRSASFWISDAAAARFKSFCDQILNIRLDEVPTEQSIFTRQSFSIVFYATNLVFDDQWALSGQEYRNGYNDRN